MEDFTTTFENSVATAAPIERAAFIRKTYLLLAAAILAFIAVEGFLFASGIADGIASIVFLGGRLGWLAIILAFMGISYLSQRWAESGISRTVQYFGLGLFVVAEAVIFVPLLYFAAYASGDASVILKA